MKKIKILAIATLVKVGLIAALYPVDGPCELNDMRCDKVLLNDDKCHRLAKQPVFAKLLKLKIVYDTGELCGS